MPFDFLKPILGDDLFAQVVAKIPDDGKIVLVNAADGTHIPKAKFDEVNEAKKGLTAQLTDLTTKLATLQQQAAGQEGLQTTIAALQKQVADKETELKSTAFKSALTDSIRGFNVHDPAVVLPLLKMDSIKQGEDGTISGLREQMDTMKTSRPYLFTQTQPNRGGFAGSPDTNKAGGTQSPNSAINAAIRGAAGYGE